MVTVSCHLFSPTTKQKAKEGFFSIKIEKLSFFETVCMFYRKNYRKFWSFTLSQDELLIFF